MRGTAITKFTRLDTQQPLLALLPSGDAFRADIVRAVRVIEDETLLGSAHLLYAVTVELDDGQTHTIGSGLDQREAKRIATDVVKEVNRCLAPGA